MQLRPHKIHFVITLKSWFHSSIFPFCLNFIFFIIYFSQQHVPNKVYLKMADSTKEVIPPGWEKRLSRSTGNWWTKFIVSTIINAPNALGIHYYLNLHTKESQWDCPTESAEPLSSNPDKVQASHLLVKHSKSRRPSSWREDNITRSKDEARKILQGYHERVGFTFLGTLWGFL